MNTATRVINAGDLGAGMASQFSLTRSSFGMGLLIVLMLMSAFVVVYLKDLNRRLFIQYQALEQVSQQHELNWSRLLLEQSTLSTQERIQGIAQSRLGMVLPADNQIKIVSIS